jgi:hypothetical protein
MNLHISHHERVEGHRHRWHVFVHGRDEPIHVELSPEDREQLGMSDEEIHDRLPDALLRHAHENRDDELPGYASWEEPLQVRHPHFLV